MSARTVATRLAKPVRTILRAPRGASPNAQRTFARMTPAGPSAASRTQALKLSILIAGSAAVIAAYSLQQRSLSLEAPAPTSSKLPEGDTSAYRSDPATGTLLPLVLDPPTSLPVSERSGKLHLVGLGVRTVSFLRVRVYVAALYVDENAWNKKHAGELLKDSEAWRRFDSARLLDKGKGKARGGVEGEEIMRTLMDAGIPCVVRIVPVRSTDFSHMRDGFTRSVQARLKMLRKTHPETMTPEVDEHLSDAVTHLKSIFPKSAFPKGSHLDLVFSPAGLKVGSNQGVPMSLTLEFEGKLVGRVDPPPPHVTAGKANVYSVASELFLAYFADKDPISLPFKESVAEGLEKTLAVV